MAIEFPRHTGDPDDEDDSDEAVSVWSGPSDTSSEMTELDQSDFPGYFTERDGRLFHSHGNAPYPLPVDAHEQHRTNGQHALLHLLLGRHCAGPVRRVLRRREDTTSTVRALDLCTGTGQWVLDMSHEFPHVKFYGLDIVPIATRHPPDNVLFEMADVNQALRYRTASFNLVHARSTSMAVTNYSMLLDEVARVLRPDGLFVAGEWGRCAALSGGRNPDLLIPFTVNFYTAVRRVLSSRRLWPAVYDHLEGLLVGSRHFDHVECRVYEMPIGDWPVDYHHRSMGMEFRSVLELYAMSMRLMLIDAGWPNVDQLIDGFRYEIYNVPGMVCRYKTVHARRTRTVN